MKTITNTLYLMFGCAVMLCSCGQEKAPVPAVCPDGSDRRIVFHTSLPELETKGAEIATDLTYLNLTAFDASDENRIVNGKLEEYFKNEKVEKSADSEKFVSDRCVWPEPGREEDLLHFFAYYPGLPDSVLVNKSAVNAGEVAFDYKIKGFSVAANIAEQADFVTAYTTGTTRNNLFAGIDLKFRHQLSRVEVKAKGSNKSCNIEIAGVGFGNVMMQGDFDFQTSDTTDGVWSETSKKDTEYIFRQGDAIVTVGAAPVSIMGSKIDADNDNCAMLIPSSFTAWSYDTDARNDKKGLYLNVLLRVIDATNTAGKGQQRYPYTDNSQGLNSPNIPVVYLAVQSDGKTVSRRLYKQGNNYVTDKGESYALSPNETVKEFGWAAVPISGEWEPGYIYTYTLDYTYGVGVHGPETPGDISPMAGDPIISDRVGVSLGFKDWQNGGSVGIVVPGN